MDYGLSMLRKEEERADRSHLLKELSCVDQLILKFGALFFGCNSLLLAVLLLQRNCYKMVNLGDTFPDFKAETTVGTIQFHDWVGESWTVLFSHPSDFTPVCTTELSRVAELVPEFEKRGVKPIALSCDSVKSHNKWIDDIKSYGNQPKPGFPYPIIADEGRELAVLLGMLDPDEKDKDGLPLTCRAVFVIAPDKRLRLSILYPATTGRNFDEILRAIDSLQLTDKKRVATPADWKCGGDCMVQPSVKEDEALTLFPKGITVVPVPSGKSYIRITPAP